MAQTVPPLELSPELLNQLVAVLAQLISPTNNESRQAAENQLNDEWIGRESAGFLMGLAGIARGHAEASMRAFSAVLLRRTVVRQPKPTPENITYWVTIGEGARNYIRFQLLQSLNQEAVSDARHKICDAVSEIARHMLVKGDNWTELLQIILESSKSTSPEQRESAFRILAAVPELVSDQDVTAVKQIFSTALQDSNDTVRLSGLEASAAFILEAAPTNLASCSELVPFMLQILPPFLQEHNEDGLVQALSDLIDLACEVPKVLRPALPDLVGFMCQIMKEAGLEDTVRQSALELLLSCAENLPGAARKFELFSNTLIPIVLEWMTDLEDDEAWYTTDDLEEEDSNANYVVAEQAMDRLARSLGGKAVLPLSFSLIPQMLGSNQWQQRHAGLMAVSAIGEGCAKIMSAELDKVLHLVLPYLRDPHPRVRYAACNAVGQISTDFAPKLQKQFHEQILSALIPVMDDSQYPRVQAHAAAALVNFAEEARNSDIAPYLDHIFQRLLVLLNTGKTYVQEQAITTMATVADSAGDKFVQYYAAIMPLLMSILRSANQKEFRMLKGKAMECATLVALAVGKEAFAADAHQFIELLKAAQLSITDDDDPQSSYLLAAWARVCEVLKEDFVPYLDVVMPPLLVSAQLKPDFAVVDPDEDYESKYSEEDGWEFVGVDGQKIGIKTTVLEEKCTAVEMLICYARALGAGFFPYVERVCEIVLPLLKFYFHDGVRFAAAATIPQLFLSVKKVQAGHEYLLKMWNAVCESILGVMESEPDPNFLCQLYTTFHESLEVVGNQCMSPALLESFTKATESQLKDYVERVDARRKSRADKDHDGEAEELLQEEEEGDSSFLQEVSNAVHQIFKTHGSSFLPCFEKLIPMIDRLLTGHDTESRKLGLCLFDDLIEFVGPSSFQYQRHFLSKMVDGVLDKSPEIRQAAVYGLGVCGQCGGEGYADVCAGALHNLFTIINAPDAREEDNVLATENAISAVAKICRYNNSKFDVNQVLPSWLATLPILEDELEATHVYSFLLELMESQHLAIFGESNSNLPKLVSILTEVLVNGILPAELETQMVARLKTTLAQCPEDVRQALWAGIEPAKRNMLMERGYLS